MSRPYEFSRNTQRMALARQKFRCGSCGTRVSALGTAGRGDHAYGEGAQAHHIRHLKSRRSETSDRALGAVDNCVILCQSCHYSAHEGGNYTRGTVMGSEADYPHFRG